MVKAIRIDRTGGPEVMQWVDVEVGAQAMAERRGERALAAAAAADQREGRRVVPPDEAGERRELTRSAAKARGPRRERPLDHGAGSADGKSPATAARKRSLHEHGLFVTGSRRTMRVAPSA